MNDPSRPEGETGPGPSGEPSPPDSPTPDQPPPPPAPQTEPTAYQPPPPPPAAETYEPYIRPDTEPDEIEDLQDIPEVQQALGFGVAAVVAGALSLYLYPARMLFELLNNLSQFGFAALPGWYWTGNIFQLLPAAGAGFVAVAAGNRVPDLAAHRGLGRIGRSLGYVALGLVAVTILVLVVEIVRAGGGGPPSPVG